MSNKLLKQTSGLGAPAVFFTAISTILGAIMFLRFGFAVGNLGFQGALGIIILGHLVTIPTALAISEIATNQKVEGGGEYYIISRSFGLNIGSAIGVALYLSQAISAAFYVIAFAQAFEPVITYLKEQHGILIYDLKIITIPTMLILVFVIIRKGADLGLKLLYFVVAILGVSLLFFFLGNTEYHNGLTESIFEIEGRHEYDFFTVFAICFPGFTGMTAGVGLSGELKNPSKSIPLGTMLATVMGMLIYIAIVWKLAAFADPKDLANDQLVMGKIALWGPIIPIGLAAATISSAIGSIIVAPRTLQALSKDNIFPLAGVNAFLRRNKKGTSEPLNATIVTSIIAVGIVLIGDVNLVAKIVSVFFMVTYGVLCLISFLEHFAADPSYRPSFRSRWTLSLLGAILCFWLMFKMDPGYSILGILIMIVIYIGVTYFSENKRGMAAIFQGVTSQFSRRLQIFLQKVDKDQSQDKWRPSVICVSSTSFDRFAAFELLKWISHKYGFGTYIHYIEGYLSKDSHLEAEETQKRLIKNAERTGSNVYVDTLISPSFTNAIVQVLQLPGISGKENNMVLFEYAKGKPGDLKEIVEHFALIKSTEFDVCLLASSIRSFGFKSAIHIWITSSDYQNANLMILLGYIISGHPDWKKADIKIFALYPQEELQDQKEKLLELIHSGRLPISPTNIELVARDENNEHKTVISKRSKDADLTIIGFRAELVKRSTDEVFKGYDDLGDVLFVNTSKQKDIS